MYNFQAGSHGPDRDAEREKAAYEKLLAKYEALNRAADEGVFLVTIQSDSGPITVPVPYTTGRNITSLLVESHCEWLEQIERYLNYSIEAIADESRADRKEKEARERQREVQAVAGRAQDAQRELAEAVAATVAQQPAQPSASQPQNTVAAALGQAAVTVPMNGTIQQPTSKATKKGGQAA